MVMVVPRFGAGAGGGGVAAVLADDIADEEEAEASAFELGGERPGTR